jgi:hypothetical protein
MSRLAVWYVWYTGPALVYIAVLCYYHQEACMRKNPPHILIGRSIVGQ